MSPRITVDTSEAVSLTPVPDDTYPCFVSEIKEVAQGPNAHYVPLVLEVEEGHEFAGRMFFNNLPIDGKGAGIFISFVNKALGLDFDVDDMEDLDFDTDELMGARVRVVSKQEEYPEDSGEFRSQVSKILAAE